jgi:hypothetical protein
VTQRNTGRIMKMLCVARPYWVASVSRVTRSSPSTLAVNYEPGAGGLHFRPRMQTALRVWDVVTAVVDLGGDQAHQRPRTKRNVSSSRALGTAARDCRITS